MPSCQNCGFKWSFKDTWKITFKFTGSSGRKCSRCDDTQYISKKSLNRIGIMGILGLILLVLIRPFLAQDLWTSVLLAVPFAVVLTVANLLLIELSGVQQTKR